MRCQDSQSLISTQEDFLGRIKVRHVATFLQFIRRLRWIIISIFVSLYVFLTRTFLTFTSLDVHTSIPGEAFNNTNVTHLSMHLAITIEIG